MLRFAHEGEYRGGYVLRGHFQLAADMVPAEFTEKFPLPVGQQIIKPDAGTDKYLLYTGNVTELFQQADIITVIRIEIPARRREKALPVPAYALLHLLRTGGVPEIGGGAAHIVDIPLEVFFLCDLPGFLYKRIMASHLDDPSLVKGQRTETASAETAPVADQAETDFRESRHAAFFIVVRMPCPCIGQIIDIVHFLRAERF